jgi:hypothetical protein
MKDAGSSQAIRTCASAPVNKVDLPDDHASAPVAAPGSLRVVQEAGASAPSACGHPCDQMEILERAPARPPVLVATGRRSVHEFAHLVAVKATDERHTGAIRPTRYRSLYRGGRCTRRLPQGP